MKLSALKESWLFSTRSDTEIRSASADCINRSAVEPNSVPVIEPVIKPTDEAIIQPARSQREIRCELNEGTPSELAVRHAERLLERLLAEWGAGEKIRYESVAIEYGEMCRAMGVNPRPWNQVGRHLALLTRKKGKPKKSYQPWIDRTGKKKQLRMYVLPLQVT